jgi:hypothetical protein
MSNQNYTKKALKYARKNAIGGGLTDSLKNTASQVAKTTSETASQVAKKAKEKALSQSKEMKNKVLTALIKIKSNISPETKLGKSLKGILGDEDYDELYKGIGHLINILQKIDNFEKFITGKNIKDLKELKETSSKLSKLIDKILSNTKLKVEVQNILKEIKVALDLLTTLLTLLEPFLPLVDIVNK